MEPSIAFCNKFDQAFKELDRRLARDPSRMKWLVDNEPDVRRLVGRLYFMDSRFNTSLANAPFLQAPRWFLQRNKDYKLRFAPHIVKVYGLLHLLAIEQDEVNGIPRDEILWPDGPDTQEQSGQFQAVTAESGADAIDFVFRWAWNMADGSDHEEELEEGIDAWSHFTEVVGIDIAGIERRWDALPRPLIPSDLLKGNSGSPFTALTELLTEATRAYVFGLHAAAMAMCRAVCEMVLQKFYVGPENDDQATLMKVVVLAEAKHDIIRKLELKKYVRFANSVLHRHDLRPAFSTEEKRTVREFLATVKSLIENAPAP